MKAASISAAIPARKLSFVWSGDRVASDSQSVTIPALSSEYKKFPFKFTPATNTEDARLEIVATGSGTFHVGCASLMPADNVQGFHTNMVKLYKEAGFKMLKWPGGNFVSAYDFRDGLGDRDKRPARIAADVVRWHRV